jgi:hypothetical protein
MNLNLACGQRPVVGFDGVDLVAGPGVEHVVDLFRVPWPFASESVEAVHCAHFVEHTPSLIAFMDELHRVMARGAHATITAPYYTSIRAWQDPTHTRAITDATFWYFNRAWREREGLSHYPITADFDIVRVEHAIRNEFRDLPPDKLQLALMHNVNVAEDITVVLERR